MESEKTSKYYYILSHVNTIVEGSKDFISDYDYYLSIAFRVRKKVMKEGLSLLQIEKQFIISELTLINNVSLDINKNSLPKKDHELISTYIDEGIYFLFSKLENVFLKLKKPLKTNPYNRIFVNDYSYNLFNELSQTISNPLADYSFIYRKMINDKFIYESVGESEFRRFLSSNYEVEIDKMKQLHICTTEIKERLYAMIKDVKQ